MHPGSPSKSTVHRFQRTRIREYEWDEDHDVAGPAASEVSLGKRGLLGPWALARGQKFHIYHIVWACVCGALTFGCGVVSTGLLFLSFKAEQVVGTAAAGGATAQVLFQPPIPLNGPDESTPSPTFFLDDGDFPHDVDSFDTRGEEEDDLPVPPSAPVEAPRGEQRGPAAGYSGPLEGEYSGPLEHTMADGQIDPILLIDFPNAQGEDWVIASAILGSLGKVQLLFMVPNSNRECRGKREWCTANKPMLRKDRPIYCILDKIVVQGQWYLNWEDTLKPHNTNDVYCEFMPEDINKHAKPGEPLMIKVSQHASCDSGGCARVPVTVPNIEPSPPREIPEGSKPFDLMMCIGSAVFLNERFGNRSPIPAAAFREWLEHHEFIDVQHFILYLDADPKVMPEFWAVAKEWLDMGKLTIFNIQKTDSREGFYAWQHLVNNHCMFYTKRLTRFTAFFDLDEFIELAPRHPKLLPLLRDKVAIKEKSGISFASIPFNPKCFAAGPFFHDDGTRKAPDCDVPWLERNTCQAQMGRRKYIVKSDDVDAMYIHDVMIAKGEYKTYTGDTHYTINVLDAHVARYLHFSHKLWPCHEARISYEESGASDEEPENVVVEIEEEIGEVWSEDGPVAKELGKRYSRDYSPETVDYQDTIDWSQWSSDKDLSQEPVITIATAFDKAYVTMMFPTWWNFILQHQNPTQRFKVILVTDEVAEEEQDCLKTVIEARPGTEAKILAMDKILDEKEYVAGDGHIHRITQGRLYLPELLPEVDRLLWLDADAGVLKPLNAMYNMEMSDDPQFGCGVIARDELDQWWGGKTMREAGIPEDLVQAEVDRMSFNAGIMVMSLDFLRKHGFKEKAELYLNYGTHDQNIMNAWCDGRQGSLPPMFNAYTNHDPFEHDQVPNDAVNMARENPEKFWAIIHYNGDKVWIHQTWKFTDPTFPWTKAHLVLLNHGKSYQDIILEQAPESIARCMAFREPYKIVGFDHMESVKASQWDEPAARLPITANKTHCLDLNPEKEQWWEITLTDTAVISGVDLTVETIERYPVGATIHINNQTCVDGIPKPEEPSTFLSLDCERPLAGSRVRISLPPDTPSEGLSLCGVWIRGLDRLSHEREWPEKAAAAERDKRFADVIEAIKRSGRPQQGRRGR